MTSGDVVETLHLSARPLGLTEAATVGGKTDVWFDSGSCTREKLLLLLLDVKCPMLHSDVLNGMFLSSELFE
jgi:hypothetical protein